jgi:hypothetical protein
MLRLENRSSPGCRLFVKVSKEAYDTLPKADLDALGGYLRNLRKP